MSTLRLKLFITGRTTRSEAAIENLQITLNQNKIEHFELNVIDILDDPRVAEDELILATPTLIKISPAPTRRVIGDLSDREVLLRSLDIRTQR